MYYKRGGAMNQHYNQNYSKDQIDAVLDKIKQCVANNKYSIARNVNRQENIDFINEYNIRIDKQKNILLQLKTEDFCHSLKNTKAGFEYEVLYVFVPKVELFNADGFKENVDIYIKVNIIDLPSGTRTVVISFHKCNKPIDYLFKRHFSN